MLYDIFTETIQAFVTSKCDKGCLRCSLKGQQYSDMTLETLGDVIQILTRLGVKCLELFANEPMQHPRIGDFVGILNNAQIRSAILTGGPKPNSPGALDRFLGILNKVNPEKISFVFSVDYKKETADEIFLRGKNYPEYPAALKAKIFWRLVPDLTARGISFRTNTVISRHNYSEVPEILERVVSVGGLASFCEAQHAAPIFYRAFQDGELSYELERKLLEKMASVEFLRESEMNSIIRGIQRILLMNQEYVFNRFRGSDPSDGLIPEKDLVRLRGDLLVLKDAFGVALLTSREFISLLGEEGVGCLELLRQGKFPQLKIGTEGQAIFCCDVHDPFTQKYKFADMHDPEVRGSFLQMIRTNPYIWYCLLFPCKWSVNYVKYITRKEEVYAS